MKPAFIDKRKQHSLNYIVLVVGIGHFVAAQFFGLGVESAFSHFCTERAGIAFFSLLKDDRGNLCLYQMKGYIQLPVGKVDFLELYPLSFREFLMAVTGIQFAKLLDSQDYKMITSFKQTYIEALKQYYFIGGMPEAVKNFTEERDFYEVREVQKRILEAYEQDFSKHAPLEIVPKIRMVWNSIPSQLAKENKKFLYGLVREGGRGTGFPLHPDTLPAQGQYSKSRPSERSVHRAH